MWLVVSDTIYCGLRCEDLFPSTLLTTFPCPLVRVAIRNPAMNNWARNIHPQVGAFGNLSANLNLKTLEKRTRVRNTA